MIDAALESVSKWKQTALSHPQDDTTIVPLEKVLETFGKFSERLAGSYPFFSPCYIGQMVCPPHPVAIAAYFAAMHINANNHALDGGPATSKMETESVKMLADMFGFQKHLGHLTSSGTIANLEALWVAKNIHPGKAVAFSKQCHYTHPRLCKVLGVKPLEIQNDKHGRMDLDDLESKS